MILWNLLEILMLIIGVLVRVAFFTLYERKILGYVQLRKGPNKLGVAGFLQPFRDAVKLFVRESTNIVTFDFALYYFCPIIRISLILIGFSVIEWRGRLLEFQHSILLLFCLIGARVYPIFGSGWSSNSKYALLGGMRAIAQTISYEVVFSTILVAYLIIVGSFNLRAIRQISVASTLYIPLLLFWVTCVLAELNRTPFDFAEGESELVSGFNVEYSRFGFAMIFMAEYGSILLLSYVTFMVFTNLSPWMTIASLIFSTLVLVARGSFPRFRYDKLMYVAWKGILPVVLNYLVFIAGVTTFVAIRV